MLATNFIMNYHTVQLCKSNNGIPKTLLCIHKISCEKKVLEQSYRLEVFTVQAS